MRTKIIIQPALRLMKIDLQYEKNEIKAKSFQLNASIMINECKVDGEVYEIDRFSKRENDVREYELPKGLSKLSLTYDAPLLGSYGNVQVLDSSVHWIPNLSEDFSLELRVPGNQIALCNLDFLGFEENAYRFSGSGDLILVIGPYRAIQNESNQFFVYTENPSDVLLRAMQKCTSYLKRHYGYGVMEEGMNFVMVPNGAKLQSKKDILFIEENAFHDYSKLGEVMTNLAQLNYPVNFDTDFKMMEKSIYCYMAYKSLEHFLSQSELDRFVEGELQEGPISELKEAGVNGLRFLLELEEQSGVDLFNDKLQRIFGSFKEKPLGLTHFYNLFARESAPRAVLEKWLFGSRA
ncbi:hypothetical protein [Guggenheimella bovis]